MTTTANSSLQMENPLANAPSSIEWIQTLELGYEQQNDNGNANGLIKRESICFSCGKKPASTSQASSTSNNNNNIDDDSDKKAETGDVTTTTTAKTKTCTTATATETNTIKLMKCSKCSVATYCCRDCQINDWKHGGHKKTCNSYKRIGIWNNAISEGGGNNEVNEGNDIITNIKASIRVELFTRIRFYACPYAVYKYSELGRGFLFIQSNQTLKNLSFQAIPNKDEYGYPVNNGHNSASGGRAILMHYLTMGEYDIEVCRDDFELTLVRTKLQNLVDTYDPETHVCLLWRLRCGHIAVGKAILVPDINICKKLGMDYYADNPASAGAVQLNLDDL